jgi:O-antigen/teichoic acid export membrane protein
LRRLRERLRLRSYDTSTEEGRALERNRRGAWTTLTNIVARALEATLSLVSIPLTIGYLGKERYGLWMALSSLLTWAALADFGMLRGLQNRLSDAYGRDDEDEARRAMSTAFFALGGLALGVGVLFAGALFAVPWVRLFNLNDPELQREFVPALASVVGVFLVQFPLRTIKQAYAAYQKGHVANLFSIAGSLLGIGSLLLIIRLRLGLPWLILASGGVASLVTLLNGLYLARDLPFLRPGLRYVDGSTLRSLALVSAPMMLFEVGSLMINEVQMIIIAHERGVSAVTDYSVYLKVMSIPLFLVNVLDSPYVPMYREAIARGDRRWFREMFHRLQWLKLALSLALALALVLLGDPLAGLLSEQSVALGATLWAVAGLNMIVGCWNGSYNNLFFAIERVWTLVWIILANGIITLLLTLLLTGPHGLLGVLVASTAFSLLVSGWLLPVLSRDVLRR